MLQNSLIRAISPKLLGGIMVASSIALLSACGGGGSSSSSPQVVPARLPALAPLQALHQARALHLDVPALRRALPPVLQLQALRARLSSSGIGSSDTAVVDPATYTGSISLAQQAKGKTRCRPTDHRQPIC